MADLYSELRPGITFPAYVFEEFPKWVTDGSGNQVIVNSAEEEAALAKPVGGDAPATEAASDQTDTDDERASLLELAAERGVKIDRRWNTAKIRAALEPK